MSTKRGWQALEKEKGLKNFVLQPPFSYLSLATTF
jgi:hypothetical protein